MDPKEHISESREDRLTPVGGPYTLTVTAEDLQVLQIALGELLGSVRRGEHLIPVIQALQAQLSTVVSSV